MSEQENPIERIGAFKNELAVENSNLVSYVSAQYIAQVNKERRKNEEWLKQLQLDVVKTEAAFEKTVKESGRKMHEREIKLILDSLRALKIRIRDEDVEAHSQLGQRKKAKEVSTRVHISWNDGSFAHTLWRRLTKEEQEMSASLDAMRIKITELEEYLLALRARKTEVVELANDAMGVIGRRAMEKVDPNLVKRLDELIAQDNYRLPDPPAPLK